LRSATIAAKAKTSGSGVKAQGRVTVQDANGAAIAGATVAITWKVPSGKTTSQTATTTAKGLASFSTTDVAGSYTLTVTNIQSSLYLRQCEQCVDEDCEKPLTPH
jgi:hypothetical protein